MSKNVLNSFNNLVQMSCFSYLRYDRVLLHKESNLKYSKDWINKNEGLTEDEIRGKFTSMVDEYDITLLDELFIEMEDCVVNWAMSSKTKQEAIDNVRALLFDFDGFYDKEIILENFDKEELIRIINNLVGLIDESVDILRIGSNRDV